MERGRSATAHGIPVGQEGKQLIRGLVASPRSWKCILQALVGFQEEMNWC